MSSRPSKVVFYSINTFLSSEGAVNQKLSEDEDSSAAEEPKSCGICLGDIEIFGILDGCSHTFCWKCITTWSRTKFDKSDCCPYCCQPFDFVYPSKTWISGRVRRKELFDNFETSLRNYSPCEFVEDKVCKLGSMCPYCDRNSKGIWVYLPTASGISERHAVPLRNLRYCPSHKGYHFSCETRWYRI